MIIYKTTNKVNGKIYIGQTNGKRKNYIGSGKILKQAIKKYGKFNFKNEILTSGNFTINECNILERYYIKLYNSTNPNIGYNIDLGGLGREGTSMTQETKNKIKIANTGKKKKPFTEQHKLNISKSKKGKKIKNNISEETKAKIRQSKLGIKFTEQHKLKLKKAKSKINISVYVNNILYGQYKSYKDCSEKLNISINTIKKYQNNDYLHCRVNKYNNYKFIVKPKK